MPAMHSGKMYMLPNFSLRSIAITPPQVLIQNCHFVYVFCLQTESSLKNLVFTRVELHTLLYCLEVLENKYGFLPQERLTR